MNAITKEKIRLVLLGVALYGEAYNLSALIKEIMYENKAKKLLKEANDIMFHDMYSQILVMRSELDTIVKSKEEQK